MVLVDVGGTVRDEDVVCDNDVVTDRSSDTLIDVLPVRDTVVVTTVENVRDCDRASEALRVALTVSDAVRDRDARCEADLVRVTDGDIDTDLRNVCEVVWLWLAEAVSLPNRVPVCVLDSVWVTF